MVRPLIISSAIVGVSVLTIFAGCSSSSSSATATGSGSSSGSKEGGTSSSGSSSGTSSSGSSSGAASSSGSKEGGASSSGSSSGGSSSGASSSGSSGDDGSTANECPDGTTFTPGTYTTPTAHQGVCETGDITSFLSACILTGATSTSCFNWQTSNVAGSDGGGGNACGNCILNVNNNGASFVTQASAVDPTKQLFGANYGACIALTDATNGAACQQAYDAANDCQGFECATCADANSQETCYNTVGATGGSCATQVAAVDPACPVADFPAQDGGVNASAVCFPSENAGATDNSLDFTYIIKLICGSADGG